MYKELYDKAVSEGKCVECLHLKEERDKHYVECFRCRLKKATYKRNRRQRLKTTLRLPFLESI